MPRKPGSAKYTENLSVAVTPEQKTEVEEAASRRGVFPATVVRWAIDEWLAANEEATRVKSDAVNAS